jgi:hypothetical protein
MARTQLADKRAQAPHGFLRPVVAAVGLYVLAALLWLTFGATLPGGRWFAVHIFTLGILTNLIVTLTHHFAETLLHTKPSGHRGARFLVLNGGVILMLSFPPSTLWPFAIGATIVAGSVVWLYVDLRRMRKASLTGRFAFVVRTYERACGAFVHGAALGVLMGVGLLGGAWFWGARLAHLHINILGWGGLTLLATVVFFGPTIMRTRMEPGADKTAAVALRHGATALTIGVIALLLIGAGDPWALPARLIAAAGLAGYAAAATAVCIPVVKAGGRAKPSAQAWMIRAACVWFIVVVWADVLVVATGRWQYLDALGALLIVAVLGQAILASLGYLSAMLAAGGPEARQVVRDWLERAPRLRVVALNIGVLAVGAAAIAGRAAGLLGTVVVRSGWALIALVVLTQLGLIAFALLRAARTPRERAA